jgi:hypothetical protein
MDPGSNSNKKEERKKIVAIGCLLCIHKFHKIENKLGTEKHLSLLTRLRNCSRNGLYPGSEIRNLEKKLIQEPRSGSRSQKSIGSRIRIRNTEKKKKQKLLIITWGSMRSKRTKIKR